MRTGTFRRVFKMKGLKLITHGNDYLLMDGDVIVSSTTDYLNVDKWYLDLDNIKELLPINDDDEFYVYSVGFKNNGNDYSYLKRTPETERDIKLKEILK